MSLIADLENQLQDILTLKYITNTFTEINSIKAKNIRANFEKNTVFFREIGEVYHLVKEIAVNKGALPKTVLFEQDVAGRGGGGTVAIAITSNMRFYGKLNINVMKKFEADAGINKNRDIIVIGATGAEYLSGHPLEKKTMKVAFRKDFPTPEEVSALIEQTKKYRRVYLYYPEFLTMVSQRVGVSDITQTPTEIPADIGKIEYIFEPELVKILEFFEMHVRTLLFNRVLLEAELSRTAARLITMSTANDRADVICQSTRTQLSKERKSFTNAQLLETFAGMGRWEV
ncbi:MAG: FoF1 ATP synthase subunit gamma [Patescibacteria group bacterium]